MNPDIYTTLVHAKRVMANGQLPPMPTVPDAVRHIIDPAFTIGGDGWGGLVEDEARGLQCPLRGCGLFLHNLAIHLRHRHKAISPRAFRKAMGLPLTAPLCSHKATQRRREIAAKQFATNPKHEQNFRIHRSSAPRAGGIAARGRRLSMGTRNLRDRCTAQIMHKIVDLQAKLGRTPAMREFMSEYGTSIQSVVSQLFGTWENAVAHCGFPAAKQGRHSMAREDILKSLSAWYDIHGSLPSSSDAQNPRRTPLIPRFETVCKAFKTNSWRSAMEMAASALQIYGGRYGIPEHLKPIESESAA